MNRGKPLDRQSKKTKARRKERKTIVDTLNAVGICQLMRHSKCRGRRAVHEVVRRSQLPGSQYDDRFTILLCEAHHDLDTHMDEAQRLGIRVPGWCWEMHGQRALDEAARIRADIFMGKDPQPPFWMVDDG